MDTTRYKSFACKISVWDIATNLGNKLIPNIKLSRSKVCELAILRLENSYKTSAIKVSSETLKQQQEVKHASNN